MNNLLFIFRYLKRHTKAIVVYFVFSLLSIIFSLVSLTMLIPFLSLIFEKTKLVYEKPVMGLSIDGLINGFNYYLSQIIIHNGKVAALGFICLLVVIAIFLKNLFSFLCSWVDAPIKNSVINDLRSDIYGKILSLPIGFFSEEKKGDILSRMTNDLQVIEVSIMEVLSVTVKEPLTILVYFVALIKLSPSLTLFLLVLLPISGFFLGKVSKALKRQSTEGQSKLGDLLSLVDETLAGMRIIKAFNAEDQRKDRFLEENDLLYRIKNGIYRKRELASPMSEFLAIIVLCFVLYFGGRLALKTPPAISADTLIAYIAIFSQLIGPVRSFSKAAYNIQLGRAGLERIEAILKNPLRIEENPNAKSVQEFHNAIIFSQVNFAYKEKQVLENINLTIPKGKMIALVGASGAGKSTLADLIPRFYDVVEGSITLDGTNIKEFRLKDLRGLMGIVTQEPILFNDTIFNNIALGTTNATQEQVERAAKIASAHQFILKKDQGYQTNIGERGLLLSGGERQRLTIARAVLKNPPILILDEATSSLDTESERFVQEAIDHLMENRTTIVIAHRLSTIQNADEILVLNEGKIVERGKHLDLIRLKGYYHKLVKMQQVA